VVFKKRQILPRYLIYYSRNTVPPALPNASSSRDLATSDSGSHTHAERTILWVDSKFNSEATMASKILSAVHPSFFLIKPHGF
jgi:hypothetical protein